MIASPVRRIVGVTEDLTMTNVMMGKIAAEIATGIATEDMTIACKSADALFNRAQVRVAPAY